MKVVSDLATRLPSTRNLAEELKVSRTTVLLAAYQELLAEGFIVGKVGAGTYVASELPEVPFGPLETQVRLVRRAGRPSHASQALASAFRLRSSERSPVGPFALQTSTMISISDNLRLTGFRKNIGDA